MKILISVDIEGVAGIVDWPQGRQGAGAEYEIGRRLMLGEVNAAIRGAVAGGATEVVVNDSHGRMYNLDPAAIAEPATYLSGPHKPDYMMQGVDDTVDAVFFLGYHGSISGPSSVLSHTYNPGVYSCARVNGHEVGEGGMNMLVCAGVGAKVALVTGDRACMDQLLQHLPGARHVITKESVTRFAAHSLHPAESCRRIEAAARDAVEHLDEIGLPVVDLPVTMELDFFTADMAEVASWCKGVERTGVRTCAITGGDPVAVFRSFVATNYITRQVEGR